MRLVEFHSNACSPCGYYDDRYSYHRYFYIQNCSSTLCQGLIERGFRRFGEYFFTPMCANCTECLSIRQNLHTFRFSKSHKRVLAKNANTAVYLSRPSVNEQKLALHEQYHRVMAEKKGWKIQKMDYMEYMEHFVNGYGDFGYEITYVIDEVLVGVGYCDVLPNGISATYFFYNHAFAHYSLGTFNILTQMLLGKSKNLSYFYPGYWIKHHHSMGYKERFKPFEVLVNTPDICEMPLWQPYVESRV